MRQASRTGSGRRSKIVRGSPKPGSNARVQLARTAERTLAVYREILGV